MNKQDLTTQLIQNDDNRKIKNQYLRQRRWFEVLFCLFCMCIGWPLYLLIYGIILLFEGRPVIYRQTRTGVNGNPFTIWKFRTMKPNQSQSRFNQVNWRHGVPDNFVFKASTTNHTTRTGEFLRKYSLDELPQLINVLRGEMSLIGPRPEIPEITKWYNGFQKTRLKIRPGITGLAQVSGRSNMNHGKKIDYDLYYIHNAGYLLDMKILMLTVLKVFKTEGAY